MNKKIDGISQPFVVNQFRGNLFILRDDLIVGGTKRQGLDVLLKSISGKDVFILALSWATVLLPWLMLASGLGNALIYLFAGLNTIP